MKKFWNLWQSVVCIVVIILLLASFGKQPLQPAANSDTLAVITEKDLIPEGTAYDAASKSVFIGSIHKRKILIIHENGKYEDFVPEAKDGLLCPLGMEVHPKTGTLWVINGWSKFAVVAKVKPTVADWTSKISCYNINTRSLQGDYTFVSPRGKPALFNDLTLSNEGLVYVTESLENIVYVLDPASGRFEEFLRPAGHNFLNGITLAPDNATMFVASTEGVLVVDTKTRTYKLLAGEVHKHPSDGLAFYQNSLICHQSSVIRRLHLNERLDSVVRSEVLDDKNLNSSTTGEVGNGWYYYIANSQIRSGINYSTMQLKPLDSLHNVIIKKRRL